MMKKTTLMLALAAMTSLNLFAAEPQMILPCPENAPLKWRMEGPAKVLKDGSVELVSSGMAERPGAIRWMPLRSGEKYVFTAEMKGENIGKKQHESHGAVLGVFIEIDGKWRQLGEKIEPGYLQCHNSRGVQGNFGQPHHRAFQRCRKTECPECPHDET